jgi:predicted nucleic acid-binding protein
VTTRGLLDTSVFIAGESGRPPHAELLPDEVAISVITVAELHAVNDLWIAATALAHRLPLVTQDSDFSALAQVPELEIIHV